MYECGSTSIAPGQRHIVLHKVRTSLSPANWWSKSIAVSVSSRARACATAALTALDMLQGVSLSRRPGIVNGDLASPLSQHSQHTPHSASTSLR